MRSRNLRVVLLFIVLGASSLLATSTVPRKSPDLTILEASGKTTQLSALKGKVVVIEFLLTDCPHCMRVAQTITKLYSDLGQKGFQPVGIAFDRGVDGSRVAAFTHGLGVNFPVGYCSSGVVDNFLGRAPSERFMVPQIVVIDRAGVIRAQSRPVGETSLEDAGHLRELINALLNEPATEAKRARARAKSN